MIKLHDPVNARYVEYDGWQDVLEFVENGGVLFDNGAQIDSDYCQSMLADEQRSAAKAAGEPYADSGVTVPFEADDALALMQVQAAFSLGVTATVIHFSNGQRLPMTPQAFPEFAAWFVERRNRFFL